jgi:hypothetical protein
MRSFAKRFHSNCGPPLEAQGTSAAKPALVTPKGVVMIDRKQNEKQKDTGQQGTLKPWEKPGQASVDPDYPKTGPDVVEQQKAKKEHRG